jgi:hypothetical protein
MLACVLHQPFYAVGNRFMVSVHGGSCAGFAQREASVTLNQGSKFGAARLDPRCLSFALQSSPRFTQGPLTQV